MMESKQVGLLLTVVVLVLAFDCGNCNTQEIGKVVSIRSNAVTRVEDSESVLHRDSRSVHRSRRMALNSTEIREALDNHNRVRRLEGASDMEIMTWNDDLATMADGWAQKCNFSHGQPSPAPSTLKYTQLGQNLYAISGASSINITAAIQAWYDEKPYFNYDTLGCKSGKPCGHYTQVVWATSRELGCAYTRCATLSKTNLTNAFLLVCNYGPPGNVETQKPFQMGSGCSQCASGSWWCNKGLCDRSCIALGPTCACNPVCRSSGSVNSATCSCSCAPGWTGIDCSVVCEDKDPMCDPKPNVYGYPPSYCTHDMYGPQIREKCPKMCNQCQVGCKDFDSRCNPKAGEYGWPPSYCSHDTYGATVTEKCPAMCNRCQAVCRDYDSRCDPNPGEYGWPPSYCNHNEYGAATRRFCPAMCNICQAIGKSNSNNFSTSAKTLLLSMMAVWLSRST